MNKLFIVFTLIGVVTATIVGGRGFGDSYTWHDLDGGLVEAQNTGKPIMYVFHKSWCGACKNLAPKFADSAEIKAMADKFVLINLLDDEHPSDAKYAPDGGYIPRIFFGSSDGVVNHDLYNKKGNPSYKYFYGDPAVIAEAMQTAYTVLKA